MGALSVALLLYGEKDSNRDAFTEEKYKDLANQFISEGFSVSTVLYNDDLFELLRIDLLQYPAVLVWVNPIEQGKDRTRLDELLREIANKGCFVSAHPDIILKMGTKEVLFTTRLMGWGENVRMYTGFEDFHNEFLQVLKSSGTRVLKQYRGNGGNGVFKIVYRDEDTVSLTHAAAGNEERILTTSELFTFFNNFLQNDGVLIDQSWNENTINGMVRCYVTGTKVCGFGYQEINALYELNNVNTKTYFPPGRRYYFTENCGLFSDLKQVMEMEWIPQLSERLSIPEETLPVIWDADFFLNHLKSSFRKYSLCEINASSVSPFPPSAVNFIVQEVKNRVGQK
jgi:hypothetical protein